MLRALFGASLVVVLAGCAHMPSQPQVNRTAKSDKFAVPKRAATVEMPTPNQTVQKRWFPKFKIKWVH